MGVGKSKIFKTGQQAGNRARVDTAVLTLKSAGRTLRQDVYVAVLKQNCCFFWNPEPLFLRPSTN